MNKFRELAGLGLLVVVCSVTQASTPLHSPWDNKPIQATDSAYACPAVAHVPQNLTMDGFYRIDDPTHSIIDPVRMEDPPFLRRTTPVSDMIKPVTSGLINRLTP